MGGRDEVEHGRGKRGGGGGGRRRRRRREGGVGVGGDFRSALVVSDGVGVAVESSAGVDALLPSRNKRLEGDKLRIGGRPLGRQLRELLNVEDCEGTGQVTGDAGEVPGIVTGIVQEGESAEAGEDLRTCERRTLGRWECEEREKKEKKREEREERGKRVERGEKEEREERRNREEKEEKTRKERKERKEEREKNSGNEGKKRR